MKKLAISLVTHNSSEHLDALMESLSVQVTSPDATYLYIHDNNSTDDTLAVISKWQSVLSSKFTIVESIVSKENLGFGRGHNKNFEIFSRVASEDDIFFIINPDTELPKGFIKKLMQHIVSDKADDFSVFEPRQLPYEHPKIYNPVTLETTWCSGAATAFKCKAFKDVNGFDEKIFLYGEDVDISWRLRDKGYRLQYLPSVEYYHYSYRHAGEVKPKQHFGSTMANLYLRTRFGRYRDIFGGILLYVAVLLLPAQFYKQKRGLLGNLFKRYPKNAGYFFKTRSKKLRPKFYNWDYEKIRAGAFYESQGSFAVKDKDLVSVIIRTIGRKNLLEMAIRSVLNQTYQNFEIIVSEDGSDTLSEFLGEFADSRIKYLAMGERKGRCITGNKALEAATGKYCVFLDEDDLFYADHLEQLLLKLQSTDADVAYSMANELPTEYGEEHKVNKEGDFILRYMEPFSLINLLQYNYIPILCAMFKRELFEQHGGFDPDLDNLEDWNLWVRYAVASKPFEFVEKVTAIYRVPMKQEKYKERHELLDYYYKQARAKQAELVLNKKVGEIICDNPITSRYGTEQRIVAALESRYPRLRLIIRAMAKVARRFV